MPAVALVPPKIVKDVMLRVGWVVFSEDSFNWVLLKNGVPLAVPKRGKLVAREVLENCLIEGQLSPGAFIEHCREVGHEF